MSTKSSTLISTTPNRPLAGVRVIVVPNEFPLPNNTGARTDVWRRMMQMHSMGAELALLTWTDAQDGAPNSSDLTQLRSIVTTEFVSTITRELPDLVKRATYLGRLPSHAASRWISIDHSKALNWARAFRPTVLLQDGLYGHAVVRWLSRQLCVPWVHRSHNIEHLYMRDQMLRATDWKRRLGLAVNLLGLKAFESSAIRGANRVLDISPSDADFWSAQGYRHIRVLPTVVDAQFARDLERNASLPPRWDVVYFGNLNTPNNVEAIRWLVLDVLPRVKDDTLRVAVAGSKASDLAIRLAAQDRRVELIRDPIDMAAIAARACVLVNPVQAGSGVNLKSVEMLFTRSRLVSTAVGVKGLTAAARSCFNVSNDAESFAAAIKEQLAAGSLPEADIQTRATARTEYDSQTGGQELTSALSLLS